MYLLLAAPNRGETDFLKSGISAPLYYMVGLIAFGTMVAVIAGGARIAAERSVGWNRQLRLTPLRARAYFRTKVLSGYLMACVSIVLLYAARDRPRRADAGGALARDDRPHPGRPDPVRDPRHRARPPADGRLDGPRAGRHHALFAFLGGTWFPITGSGWLAEVARWIPSYWLVKAGQIGVGGEAWGAAAGW